MDAKFEEIKSSAYMHEFNKAERRKRTNFKRSCIAVPSVNIPKSNTTSFVKAPKIKTKQLRLFKKESKKSIESFIKGSKENIKPFIKMKIELLKFKQMFNTIKLKESEQEKFKRVKTKWGEWQLIAIAEKTRKSAITLVVVLALIIACAAGVGYRPAIEVAYGNENIGIVRNTQEFEKNLNESIKELNILIGREVAFEKQPIFMKKWVTKKDFTAPDKFKENLKTMVDITVSAYAIIIEGQQMALAKDEDTVQTVLENIKSEYITDDSYTEVSFIQDMYIEKVNVKIGEVQEEEDVIKALKSTKNQVETYVVKETDSLWNIALHNRISLDDIATMNPGLTERIYPGQEINLSKPEQVLSVETKKVIEYEEDIPFEKKVVNDSNMYVGKKEVVEKGESGKRKIEAKVVSINGIETNKEVINTIVLCDPKTQTEKIGTKPMPAKAATGVFRRPTYGMLTSRFGNRRGGMHTGIDLSGRVGDPINCADGGTVIFAGWGGGYGNLLKVDHGNGYITYYAHCSKLLVKSGQKVAKGETIASVGSTGNSTGPHLHFEVRKNGVPQNPLNYLN